MPNTANDGYEKPDADLLPGHYLSAWTSASWVKVILPPTNKVMIRTAG